MSEFNLHIIDHSEWRVPSRYQKLVSIGHGAFGSVCSAFDNVLKRHVAIKKLARPFESSSYAKVTYRELIIMNHMDHDNVVCLIEAFTPQTSRDTFKDVYMVTPWIGPDLTTYIMNKTILADHVQFFVYQILRALKYIHSSGVIHRDLKPANISVSSDSELKILDFGLARQIDNDMTTYVVTRWYRAPEVLLSWMDYNDRVDIWSVGCIMAELFTGTPLFPGNNLLDQLRQIIHLLGIPDQEFMSKVEDQFTKDFIESSVRPTMDDNGFDKYIKKHTSDTKALDLLKKMLIIDPDRRISATEALAHPYLEDLRDEDDEPEAPPFHDEMGINKELDVEEWKDAVWNMLCTFSPKINSLSLKE